MELGTNVAKNGEGEEEENKNEGIVEYGVREDEGGEKVDDESDEAEEDEDEVEDDSDEVEEDEEEVRVRVEEEVKDESDEVEEDQGAAMGKEELRKRLKIVYSKFVNETDKTGREQLELEMLVITTLLRSGDSEVLPLPSTKEGTAFWFVQKLFEIAGKPEALSTELVHFQNTWWASSLTTCRSLYVRDCYHSFAKSIMDTREKQHKRGVFLVTGTPGIGKSGFGLFMLIKLMKDHSDVPILYVHKNDPVALLLPSANAVKRVSSAFRAASPGVFQIKSDSTATDLLGIQDLIRIVDPAKEQPVSLTGIACHVIISSPDGGKLSEVHKSQMKVEYLMDLWTTAELMQVRQLHKVGAKVLKVHELKSRIRKFGGVPRLVFFPNAEAEQRKALDAVTMDDLKGYFSLQQKGDMSALIVHRVPGENGTESTVFASPYVKDALFHKFLEINRFELRLLVESAKGSNVLGQFRGNILEYEWHEKMPKLGTQLVQRLGTELAPFAQSLSLPPQNRPKAFQVVFPALQTLPSFDTLPTSIEPSKYYRPKITNLESVDSFFVCDHSLFTGGTTNELCIVATQMTISKKHGLRNSGLTEIKKLAEDNNIKQMVILFVSEKGTITRPQNILNEKGVKYVKQQPEACRIEQYLLELDSNIV